MRLAIPCLAAVVVGMAGSMAVAQPDHVRISQVFPLGGLLASGPNADYVELYNDGEVAVPLAGMSVQAASQQQPGWAVVPLFGAIQPHGYFLVRVSAPQVTGWPIAADVNASASINAMYDWGKVALVNGLDPLVGRPECPFPAAVLDFVGYGGQTPSPPGADQRSPCGPAEDVANNAPYTFAVLPTLRVFADFRKCGGAVNSGNNAADFYLGDPAPRNTLSSTNSGAAPDGVVRFPTTATQAGTDIQITVDPITWCAESLTSVVADLTTMGGPASIPLSAQSASVYAGTLPIPASAMPGVYQIPVRMADSNGRTTTRSGTLRVLDPIPNNDLCSADPAVQAPFMLTVGVPVSGDTTSATSVNDGPNPCQLTTPHNSLWYYFVAPETREYLVTFCTGMGYPDANTGLVVTIFQTTDCQHFSMVSSCNTAAACISLRPRIIDNSAVMQAGARYAIRVTTTTGVGMAYRLQVLASTVKGESCDYLATLQGTDNTGFGNFVGTTQGTAEALNGGAFSCVPSGTTHDFYYIFSMQSPPGTMTIDTVGSSIDTVISASNDLGSGGCFPNTTFIACNDDAGIAADPTASRITIPIQSRTLLRIAQKSPPGTPGGEFRLNMTSMSVPNNETCADAYSLTLSFVSQGFRANNNAVAALAADAPPIACAPSATRDLFWKFTANQTGVWDVSLCNDSPDAMVIQVLNGCGAGATVVGCSDDQARCNVGGGPRVRFNGVNGTQYVVRVAAKNGVGGPIRPAIELARPDNDDCAGASMLQLDVPVTVDDTFATMTRTVQNYECTPNFYPSAQRDVYFTFTPPATAAYDLSTCELGDHTVITLHSECPITYDNTLACSSYPQSGTGPCGGTSSAAKIAGIVLLADHTYYVRCGTNNPSSWTLRATSQLPLGACRVGGLCIPTDQPRCSGLWTSGPACPRSLDVAVGACCTGSICVLTPSASCVGAGLRFVGAGTVCNAPGDRTMPCCAGDFNQGGQSSVQDIFDFLAAYFGGDGRADVNGSATISVQDIFDYLVSYFAGCQ